jgi:IQ calmodulin-binding motif
MSQANVVQSQAHSAAATKIQARIRGHQAKQHVSQIADRGAPLDCAGVKKGLHTLGRNPHTLRHCMIGCSLQALELSDIAAIAEFPLLQVIQYI